MHFKEFLYRFILKRPGEREEGDSGANDYMALRHRVIDWLYFWLGLFTHAYGIVLTLLFFSRIAERWSALVSALDALQEPYLGGLGIYVVLKEIEQRRHHRAGKHYGEYFVAAWGILLCIATALVLFSSAYRFDDIYKIIVTNGLAAIIIYIGSLISRP